MPDSSPFLRLDGLRRLLCIGAHPGDIEAGAGGAITCIIRNSPNIEVWWVVFGCEAPTLEREARRAAKLFLGGAARSKVHIHGFREGCMLFQGEQVRETFQGMDRAFSPDLILTNGGDGLTDHRLIRELTRETWSDRTILEYEICGPRDHTCSA